MVQLTKDSFEKFPITFPFANDLGADEVLASYTITCVNVETQVDTKTSIIDSDSLPSPYLDVQVIIKGGTSLEEHKITVLATSDLANTFRKDLLLCINDYWQDSFSKPPDEEFTNKIDFTDDLETGDSISSVTILAEDMEGVDVSSVVISGNEIDSPLVYVGVQAGTDGDFDIIRTRATTGLGYKYANNVLMMVRPT